MLFDLPQARFAVRGFADRQQIAGLGIQQEQDAVEERERRLERVAQLVVGGRFLLAEPLLAVGDKAVGQMRKDLQKDATLEPLAEGHRVIAALFGNRIEPTTGLAIGAGIERLRAEEEPPVAEGFVRIGVARCEEHIGQIDLVEIGRPRMGAAAIKPPLPAIGDNDPIGDTHFQRAHYARAGVFIGRVGVEIVIGTIEPANPGVDEGDRFAEGLPDWEHSPGYMNIPLMLWLRNLALAYDLHEYARMRYNLLGNGGHWFPGLNAAHVDELELNKALANSPFAKQIPNWLRETHELLSGTEQQRLSAG